MATTIRFDMEEIERLIREEVARKYHHETSCVEFLFAEDYFEEEVEIEATLGGPMPPERGGQWDR